jgi:CoA:oxalate CoA-transferase
VFFGGYTDKFWAITCALFGEPDKATDPAIDTMEKRFDATVAETIVKPLLERWFSAYTKAELEEMAGDKVPLSAIKTIGEVVEDPHIAARNMIVNVPIAGKLIGMFGLPIKLSGQQEITNEKAPAPGEHNALVFAELAGIAADELDRLRSAGAI